MRTCLHGILLLLLAAAPAFGADPAAPGQKLYFQQFDTPPMHPGTTDTDADQNLSVFGKASVQDFILAGAFITRERQIPTDRPGQADLPIVKSSAMKARYENITCSRSGDAGGIERLGGG